jgi:putative acetyltransferase
VALNHAKVRLVSPVAEGDWRKARRLIEQYAASLNVDLCFQNCVGLRRISDDVAEMKRLYAVPAARGRGIGCLLAEGIIDASRGLGYATVVLDTLSSMKEARALYATLGFKATSAYRFNPVPGTSYLELKLR